MAKGTIVKFSSQNRIFFIENTNTEMIFDGIVELLKSIGPINDDDNSFKYFKYQKNFYNTLPDIFKESIKVNYVELNENEINNYDYYLSINVICYFNSNKIELLIYKKSGLLIKSKIWDCNKLSGNCIDRFIRNKIISKFNFIEYLIGQIKYREKDRTDKIEYHQTSCYEKDYLQLCLMRDTARKMMEDCNDKLIALSEKYTKID